jgi:hypothetical protein
VAQTHQFDLDPPQYLVVELNRLSSVRPSLLMVGHHPRDPDAKARGKPSAVLSISASKIRRLASTAVDQACERDGGT